MSPTSAIPMLAPTEPADVNASPTKRELQVDLDSDAIELSSSEYGLDERARSALQAFARFSGESGFLGTLGIRLAEHLPPPAGLSLADTEAYLNFITCLADLPAQDLKPEWLDRLTRLWLQILMKGERPDLPSRAARHLVSLCVAELSAGRDSMSRLQIEIARALSDAALFVSGMLAEATYSLQRSHLRQLEYFDPDTALPNARYLPELLGRCLAAGNGPLTGLLVVRFESDPNIAALDGSAHSQLQSLALARVRPSLRTADILCRIGRAECALVMPSLSSEGQLILAANKLSRLMEVPFAVSQREMRLRIRIGAAYAPAHGKDAASLLQKAQLALLETRRSERHFELFTAQLEQQIEEQAALEADYLSALDRGAFELYLQPQIHLASGRCDGAEALLRWRNVNGAFVPPPTIIHLAECTGTLPRLTRWIIHQACQTSQALRRKDIRIRLSVNLTASDASDSELPEIVKHSLNLWRVHPAALTLELTESAMLKNEAETAEVMRRLRGIGCATSIDDFGTGYSCVLNLRHLPLNELKIDKAFVGRMAHSPQDKEIVRCLLQLASSLRLEAVAEGVEDDETSSLLRTLGCHRAQGYLFSRPIDTEQFVSWWNMRIST